MTRRDDDTAAALLAMLRRAGAQDIAQGVGGKHRWIEGRVGGRLIRQVFGASVSDRRAMLNALSDMRRSIRAAGVDVGPLAHDGRKGDRRPRNRARRREITVPAAPALPDWRLALAGLLQGDNND